MNDYSDCQDWWLVSRFKEKHPNVELSHGHLQCMAAIVDGLGSPWNISTNWDKCNWHYNHRGAISFLYSSDLCSFDSGRLTALVLAAHKHCVRVSIEPCTPRAMRISFWPRDPDATNMSGRHPKLDDLARRCQQLETAE